MHKSIAPAVAGLLLAACSAGTDPSGNPAIETSDVEAIAAGQWHGGTNFSGTWELETTVTATNCLPVPGLPLPLKGEQDTDTVVFVHAGGELTQLLDLGSVYTFRGGISGSGVEGTFEYGVFYDLPGGVSFIEVVRGTMRHEDTTAIAATMTATAKRRYLAPVVDCSAEVSITGTRTLTGGGSEDPGEE